MEFRRVLFRSSGNVALGPLWDPVAVRIAFDAQPGATLPMRLGGKIGPLSGDPVDVTCTVKALKSDMVMTGLSGAPAAMGDCALVEAKGIEIVLSSVRNQAINVNLFTQRSEEHTSELQSLMRISYAVFCLKKKKIQEKRKTTY